ncbi:hypothetical protein [Modestobacter marinus]|uniref:hypothetical protein n=1 Tax=Modestobacter marinus TaxID=477641 RepID=UPI00201A81EB|nr:hypothetical protein [Modestobacter marinus]
MNGLPRLAVHVGRQVPDLLLDVLTAATPWCVPVAVSSHETPPDGVVAQLYCSEVLPRRPAPPFAVWRSGTETVPAGPSLVLAAAGAAVVGDLVVSPTPVPADARPVLPYTRSRYRELRGLPTRMIAVAEGDELTWDSGDDLPRPAAAGSWPTLAALAAAVVVTGEHLWSALTWAAPVVTDSQSARHWGLTDGTEVLVADDPAARRALAGALALDQARAAGLAAAGWTAAQQRAAARVAERLTSALGLTRRHDLVPAAGLTTALDRLGTPRSAFIRRRARAAAAPLPGAVTHGWLPTERTLDAPV